MLENLLDPLERLAQPAETFGIALGRMCAKPAQVGAPSLVVRERRLRVESGSSNATFRSIAACELR